MGRGAGRRADVGIGPYGRRAEGAGGEFGAYIWSVSNRMVTGPSF